MKIYTYNIQIFSFILSFLTILSLTLGMCPGPHNFWKTYDLKHSFQVLSRMEHAYFEKFPEYNIQDNYS